jgi:hypothetical protein
MDIKQSVVQFDQAQLIDKKRVNSIEKIYTSEIKLFSHKKII